MKILFISNKLSLAFSVIAVSTLGGMVWYITGTRQTKKLTKRKTRHRKEFIYPIENFKLGVLYFGSVASLFFFLYRGLKVISSYHHTLSFTHGERKRPELHDILQGHITAANGNSTVVVDTIEFPNKAANAVENFIIRKYDISNGNKLLEFQGQPISVVEIWDKDLIFEGSDGSKLALEPSKFRSKMLRALDRRDIGEKVQIQISDKEPSNRRTRGFRQTLLGLASAFGVKSVYTCAIGERSVNFKGDFFIFGKFGTRDGKKVLEKIVHWARNKNDLDRYFFDKLTRNAVLAVASAGLLGVFASLLYRRLKYYRKQQTFAEFVDSELESSRLMAPKGLGDSLPVLKSSTSSEYYDTVSKEITAQELLAKYGCECGEYYKNVVIPSCGHIICCFHCFIKKKYKNCSKCHEKITSHMIVKTS